MRRSRTARSLETRRRAAAALTTQLRTLTLEIAPQTITCFVPVGAEPDTRGFLSWAHDAGIEVLLPISRSDGLLDWARYQPGHFRRGHFGIHEPTGERLPPEVAGRAQLMLIPACAIDHHGMRLGWGRGYFDRTLAHLHQMPRVFAVVHDDEIVDRVPTEPHDVPVDGAVTPTRIVRYDAAPPVDVLLAELDEPDELLADPPLDELPEAIDEADAADAPPDDDRESVR